jgi:hypothetical protein
MESRGGGKKHITVLILENGVAYFVICTCSKSVGSRGKVVAVVGVW